MIYIFRALVIAAAMAFTSPAWAAGDVWRGGEFRGTVILTITGNVNLPTRTAVSEDIDKFFIVNEINFDTAAQFDVAALLALPQSSIQADFPKGGKVYLFEGPLLKDVLDSVGASGRSVTVNALNGIAVEIPLVDAIESGAVVALKRDGIPFAIGDFGPTQIVFPRAERANLAGMPDNWWVWSVFHIKVE